MELCELHVHLPPSEPSTSAATPGQSATPVVTIHRLDTPHMLDERRVSFASKPQRLHRVDDIATTPWTYRFPCKSEEVHTFELTKPVHHGAEKTYLDWWQDDDNLNEGPGRFLTITLVQPRILSW